MQRRAIAILTCMISANHWYAEDKFHRGINSYDGINLYDTGAPIRKYRALKSIGL